MDANQNDMSREDIEARVKKLEKRIIALEKHTGIKVKRTRRTREYTDEERATIRERLKAGQEAAKKKREAETKPGKKAGN